MIILESINFYLIVILTDERFTINYMNFMLFIDEMKI